MVYKRYIKKKSGTICGFYIYHSIKKNGKVITIHIGKQTDTTPEIELVCNLLAQNFFKIWKNSEEYIDKYLRCYE